MLFDVNVKVKRKDGAGISPAETATFVEFCDETFGTREDGYFIFNSFANNGKEIHTRAEDVDSELYEQKIKFDEYTRQHPEMTVKVDAEWKWI